MDRDRIAPLHGILRSMVSLTRVFEARGMHPFQEQALGRREMDVMFFVSQSEQQMTVGQLAGALHVSSAAISQVLSKLDSIGLVNVTIDPADRRHRLIGLTESATTEVRQFQDAYVRTLLPQFHALTDAELRRLEQLLAKVQQ